MKQQKVSEHLNAVVAAAGVGGDTAVDVVDVVEASVQTVFLMEMSLDLFPRALNRAKERREAFLG